LAEVKLQPKKCTIFAQTGFNQSALISIMLEM
jgi:hypothetical protein